MAHIKDKHGKDVPDCCYHPNDVLAHMIVEAWSDSKYKERLLDPDSVKAEFHGLGLCISKPVVLEEGKDYQMSDSDEKVFVLPGRPKSADDQSYVELLATARTLMACCPHGI